MSLEDACREAAKAGCHGFDLIGPKDWPVLKKYGLIPTMYPPGPGGTIQNALNRTENHAALEKPMHAAIDEAAANGVPNIITFSGNRNGMADAEGADHCVEFLNRVKAHAEDKGVTICMEYLNSKVNHKDYMFDHIAWGVDVMKRVNSPRVKILFDIYHAQIMDGDIVRNIRDYYPVDRALPYRGQSGAARDRRNAGAELPVRGAGHRGPEFHGVCGARVHAGRGARSAGEPGAGDEDHAGVEEAEYHSAAGYHPAPHKTDC